MRVSAQLSALAISLTSIACSTGGWAPCLIDCTTSIFTIVLQGAFPGGDELVRLNGRDVSTTPCGPQYNCPRGIQTRDYNDVLAVRADDDTSFDTFARNGTKLGRLLFTAHQMAEYGILLRNHTGHDVIATKQGSNNYTISSFSWAGSGPPDLERGIAERDHYFSGSYNLQFGDSYNQSIVRRSSSSAGWDLANQFTYDIFQYSPGPSYSAQIYTNDSKLITQGQLAFQF